MGLPLMKLGRAAEAAPPSRVIFVFTENGTYPDAWRTPFAGTPTSDRLSWEVDLSARAVGELSPILQALGRWRDKMIALDGLSLLTAMADPYGDSHARGTVACLTGGFATRGVNGTSSFAGHPSLDQHIREYLRAADPSLTDLTSMELAIAPNATRVNNLSYGTGSDGLPYRVPWEIQPTSVFDLLYPGRATDSLARGRNVVLDRLHAQYQAIAPGLTGEDRARIDLHRDLLSDVLRREDLLSQSVCGSLALPAFAEQSWEGNGGALMRYRRDNFIDLLVQAMACGVTRVGTLSMTPPPMDVVGGVGDFHNDYSHQCGPGAPQEKIDVVVAANLEYARMIDRLLTALDSVPEQGGTMLDSTTVVWVNELATGGHDLAPYNVLLFGGAHSPFKLGRYLRFAQTTPPPVTTSTVTSVGSPDALWGPPHNYLLVSLAQAMGLPDNVVGERSLRCRWADGSSVNVGLTGRLEELYA
jgi:hypothetical protein